MFVLLSFMRISSNGPVDGAYGQQHSPVSRSDASTEDAELSAALAHQHHLAMQVRLKATGKFILLLF